MTKKIKAKCIRTERAENLPTALDDIKYTIFPGFCDVHVHFREPGFSYKETIRTGSLAAARGGYTAVCTMPNLNPVPDSVAHLQEQLKIIETDAVIHVYPYGAITVGEKGEELSDLEGMAGEVIAFSDDGKGVQSEDRMREAMLRAKALGKMIVAHCEDNALLFGGYIHDGVYAAAHGHKGICSESEWGPIKRDLRLAKETGCAYHVCHISCKESVELIRQAKADGVDVTCETAPHYLILCEEDLKEDGRFKMNPPLRSAEDKAALIEGIKDGTIDVIATDHAPHAAEEKAKGLAGSAFGIVGIETAFPLLYTYLVKPGVISLEKLIDLLAVNPRRRFGISGLCETVELDCADDTENCGDGTNASATKIGANEICADDTENNENCGSACDYTVWDLNEKYTIDPADFLSLGKATPFEGWEVYGKCCLTVCEGNIVYESEGTS